MSGEVGCDAPVERLVRRYACPLCGKSGSSKARISSHIFRCWKNPLARSCGTCEHHVPPERGEAPDYYSGYPGSPDYPRACEAGVQNAQEMPRGCVLWAPAEPPQ